MINEKRLEKLIDHSLSLPVGKRKIIIQRFLSFLSENPRFLPIFLKIIKRYKRKNRVYLFFAMKQDSRMVSMVSEKIKRIFAKREIEIHYTPELISGFLAQDINFRVDCSIKGLLDKLKQWTF